MDKICYNGSIAGLAELPVRPGELLDADYVYQRMHAAGGRVKELEAHLDIVNRTMEAVYGVGFAVTADEIGGRAAALMQANRYGSDTALEVTLRVFPHPLVRVAETRRPVAVIDAIEPIGFQHKDGEAAEAIRPDYTVSYNPSYLIECGEPLYYRKYTVWHKRPMLLCLPCEYLFMGYPTATSLRVARYSRDVAVRSGADAAVIENMDGTLTHVEDEPLFLVFGKEVLTSPVAEGAADSVMRQKVVAACRAEGIALTEERLTRGMLKTCDEAFFPTVQGLTAAMGYRDRLYYNFTAPRLVRHF